MPTPNATEGSEAAPRVSPSSSGGTARSTRGMLVEGATPPFCVAGASPARVKRCVQWRAINPPLVGVAPSTVIPSGRRPDWLGEPGEMARATDGWRQQHSRGWIGFSPTLSRSMQSAQSCISLRRSGKNAVRLSARRFESRTAWANCYSMKSGPKPNTSSRIVLAMARNPCLVIRSGCTSTPQISGSVRRKVPMQNGFRNHLVRG